MDINMKYFKENVEPGLVKSRKMIDKILEDSPDIMEKVKECKEEYKRTK